MSQPIPPAPENPASTRAGRHWPWIVGVVAAFLAGVGAASATVQRPAVDQTAAAAPTTITRTVTVPASATTAAPVTIVSTVTAPQETVTRTVISSAAPAAPRSGGNGTLSDGVHRIGTDAKAGRWKTAGPRDSFGCYWSRNSNDSGDFSAIIANGLVQGPTSVTVKSGEFLELSGGCTWTHE